MCVFGKLVRIFFREFIEVHSGGEKEKFLLESGKAQEFFY